MGYVVLDPEDFLERGLFFESKFRDKVAQFDWQQFDGQRVLVRGCTSKVIPPWAYMVITGRLVNFASAVYFGSEHDRIPVFNRRQDWQQVQTEL